MKFVSPDSGFFSYAGYVDMNVSATDAILNRQVPNCPFGIDDPCVSISFQTDAQKVLISLEYWDKNDMQGHHAYSSRGVVLVDGNPECFFDRAEDDRGPFSSEIYWQSPWKVRTYELVFPIADKITFRGVSLDDESVLYRIDNIKKVIYAAYGESVTQGFMASDPTKCASYLVAKSKGWQLINLGYGGRCLSYEDAYVVVKANPDIITFASGGNDCLNDTPLPEFQSTLHRTLFEIRTFGCTAPVYVITPFNQPGKWKGLENQEDYREVIRSVVCELSGDGVYIIEGPSLIPDELEYFVDGVHPNDSGFQELSRNLSILLEFPE